MARPNVDVGLRAIHPPKILHEVGRAHSHEIELRFHHGASRRIKGVTNIIGCNNLGGVSVVRTLDFDDGLMRAAFVMESTLTRVKVPPRHVHGHEPEELAEQFGDGDGTGVIGVIGGTCVVEGNQFTDTYDHCKTLVERGLKLRQKNRKVVE